MEDISFEDREKKEKQGWIIIDEYELRQEKYQIKSMLFSIASNVKEYYYLLSLPILEVWEIILLNLLKNYQGQSPNGNNR